MRLPLKRCVLAIAASTLLISTSARADVTKVTIASRSVVAAGQSFGQVGPYKKLSGTIEFAVDPADKHNAPVVDLDHAPRAADGRVHFPGIRDYASAGKLKESGIRIQGWAR